MGARHDVAADIAPLARLDPSELLDAALRRFSSRARHELVPRDTLVLVVRCTACGEGHQASFVFEHSPYFGAVGDPVYLDLDDCFAMLERSLGERHPSIDQVAFRRARSCACGAPDHLARAELAMLLRAMPGSGATLAVGVDRLDGSIRRALFRVPTDGHPRSIDGTSARAVHEAFGRPLSSFDAWPSAEELAPGAVHAAALEEGVMLVLGPSAGEVRARADANGPGAIAIVLTAADIEGPAWPARPRRVARAAGFACILVSRAAIARELALVAERAGGHLEGGALHLGSLSWPLALPQIAIVMARYGRTLAEACAHAVASIVASAERALAVLEAAAAARPGLSFELDGARATAVHADGRRGRSFALHELPPTLDPARPTFARDVAFLCDELEPWGDPTRVCPCGAPAAVFARLVPAAEAPEGAWVLARFGREREDTALAVVAVGCERHVRVLRREALVEWIDDVRARIARDEPSLRVDARVVEDDRGRRAVLAKGPLAAALAIDDGLARGLLRSLGAHLEDVEAWTFAEGVACLVEPEFGEPARIVALACRAGGVPEGGVPALAIRRRVAPAPARGRFLTMQEG